MHFRAAPCLLHVLPISIVSIYDELHGTPNYRDSIEDKYLTLTFQVWLYFYGYVGLKLIEDDLRKETGAVC